MNDSLPSSQDRKPGFYTFVLKNKLDELPRLHDWLEQTIGCVKISSKHAFRLQLVLVEAVTNVIKYAYSDITEHEIEIVLHHWETITAVQVQDDGLPFDLCQQPQREFPDRLEEAGEGGLGILLIRYYTDECQYRREDCKNVLTLIIRDSE
jgi:serine/threonine-protein kinase RsbW